MVAALIAGAFASCNSSEDDYFFEYDLSEYSSVMVSSFSLSSCSDTLLENVDTVYFAIDINQASIFNPDSLPKGSDVSRCLINIGLPSVSEAKIILPAEGDAVPDTINYLESPTDTVDFSRGPVTLRVVSLDQKTKLDYTIKINVHDMVPDSLYWNRTSSRSLPGGLSKPTAQGTVEHAGKYLTFVTDGASTMKCVTTNPGIGGWTTGSVTLPVGAVLPSVVSDGENLYMTTESGTLYSSADDGQTWTSTGSQMNHIYGVYESSVLGARKKADGSYVYVTYPATTEVAVPASCPVSGTSMPVIYSTEWSTDKLMVILGGRTASGEYTGHAWAYDGGQWADITSAGIPAIDGVTLVPYFAYKVDEYWVATKQTVLLAFAGVLSDGEYNRTTYISLDRGLNWSKAADLLQLPDYIPGLYGAQGIVAESELTSRSGSAWTSHPDRRLPGWYGVETLSAASSRAVKPITSWDCPYIYLFGGELNDGTLNSTIWRGVINRLSFKPLQ
ncbi:MAG: DUF6242 domain-containing protein [Muribaculaceae bacterium]|nr:DUF6242 domain-containing protein [Muribaculaceae bacterium]